MSLDSVDQGLLFAVGAALVLVIWAVVVFVVELRRTGSAPWTEYYNDRFLPMFRGRQKHA